MHIIVYIYLFKKGSLFPFAQLYMTGTASMFRLNKPSKEKLISPFKTFWGNHFRPLTSRLNSPFKSKFLQQIEYFNSNRYWHCKTNYYRQKPRIIRHQLSRFIQSPQMFLSRSNKARFSGSEYKRLLFEAINCLPSLFNFLTPHMRYQSSSHTDVPVLKT